MKKEMGRFSSLPEGCISHVLSFTSPKDVCRLSLVSSSFRSAADSNVVWERFLPSDCPEILSTSVSPVAFSSKKELYFSLCDHPILVDGGKKTFSLEKSTGKKCYVLSARDLSITWANDPMYWIWKSQPHSRFLKVVELLNISWLEIHGKINTRMLSPKTTYAAYLIMKFANRAYGLGAHPTELLIEVGNHQYRGTAYLSCSENQQQQTLQRHHNNWDHLYNWQRIQVMESWVQEEEGRVPSQRNDGWMEIELGEFFNDGGQGEVKMSLMEVKGYRLKGGLIIEGIEVRPKE